MLEKHIFWHEINRKLSTFHGSSNRISGFFNSTALYSMIDPKTAFIPFARAQYGSGQINARDAIRQGDESQTPLHFIYDQADCRLFYTAEMTVDATAVWEKVIDVAWKGDACVVGELSKRSSMAEKSRKKAAYRHAKRRQMMTSAKIKALRDSLDMYTDVTAITPRQGLMLP